MQDKILKAYAYSILAKDASSRWSNPRKVLRQYEDVMEMASGTERKDDFNAVIGAAIKEGLAEATVVQPTQSAPVVHKPKVDRTAKDFYNFRKDQYNMNKALMAKLDALAPKAVEVTESEAT